MPQKIILLDMDDTIENLTEAWVAYANRRFGTSVQAEKITTWNPSEAFPPDCRQAMYELLLEDALYENVRPLPGAVEGVRRLLEDGHTVYIVTNTQYKVAAVKMDGVLFRYFPYLTWKNVIFASDKAMIRGDILVDDGPQNLEHGAYEKILFTAPHNRAYDAAAHGMYRANDWEEAYALITSLCAE